MKIIDRFYLLTFAIIIVGLPICVYIKITEPNVYTYNVAIYGDTIDASMLAYYIDQSISKQLRHYQKLIRFNITLISTPEASRQQQPQSSQLNKMMYSFCGVEREWMNLVENTNLRYNIKEYGVYFGQLIEGRDKNQFRIYSTTSSLIEQMREYGLSNYAAYNFFLKFAKSINSSSSSRPPKEVRIQELTTLNIIRRYFPSQIEEDSVKYFSEKQGLDSKYINKFILPVIMGNYLHQANSLSTLYKLLPVYCHKAPAIGKSLAIYDEPSKIQQRILADIKTVNLHFVRSKVLETYSIVRDKASQKKKHVNIVLNKKRVQEEQTSHSNINDTLREYIRSDVLFIFDDYESITPSKQIYYYKTVIDGKIKNDQMYEEFFTVYLKANPKKKQQPLMKEDAKKERVEGKMGAKIYGNQIYSITRVCALNCKGFENSVYILVSKHRLFNSKNLQMFESHSVKSCRKFFIEKSQMPNNKKLQENENVYKLYNIESISDSYELQLNLAKQISQALIDKIKRQYRL